MNSIGNRSLQLLDIPSVICILLNNLHLILASSSIYILLLQIIVRLAGGICSNSNEYVTPFINCLSNHLL